MRPEFCDCFLGDATRSKKARLSTLKDSRLRPSFSTSTPALDVVKTHEEDHPKTNTSWWFQTV